MGQSQVAMGWDKKVSHATCTSPGIGNKDG